MPDRLLNDTQMTHWYFFPDPNPSACKSSAAVHYGTCSFERFDGQKATEYVREVEITVRSE